MSSKTAKTPSKTTARKAVSKRHTVASLAQNLKSLETRLKGADTKNRKVIKALEAVVADIKVSARQSDITQKAALTRGLNQLEIRMETYLKRAADQARADVKSELGNITTAGANFSTIEEAVSAAHVRLDSMDSLQRESLARLNRHIAGLATSVDQRLSSESEARTAQTAALDAKIDIVRETVEKRVDQVETDTANALETVGAKVAEFAAVLEKRAKTSDAETADRLADLAQETQSGFNMAQNDIAARLEALEVIAAAWSPVEEPAMANPYLPANADDPRIDQMDETIRSLQAELSRMHARFATVQHSGQPQASALAPVHNSVNAPSNILSMPIKTGDIHDNPYAAAAQALGASTSQTSISPPDPTPAPAPAPAPAAQTYKTKSQESHIPQEFDPSAFAPHDTLPTAMSPQPMSAQQPLAPPPLAPPPLAPPMASAGAFAPMQSAPKLDSNARAEPLISAPQPISTYADPAYAEGNEMRAERIGGESSKRAKRAGPPKLPFSGRNLRVGALAVGVAVTGLFAAKTILGGPAPDGLEIASTESQAAPAQGTETFNTQNAAFSEPIGTPPPPAEPIGQYAETKTPTFVKGQEDTLDAAVASGNPIAQFQKGLAQLQVGQMEEGARLIRLSANRNQPAAQYRLAKLYETGTGVAKDPLTARELIERAARGGNRIAMHDLGNYHAYGQGGLTSDIDQALSWFTKAAERGVVDSQFNVAFLREGNEGVPADIDTALFWYHIAARQGDQGAPDRIAVLSAQLDAAARADIKSRADQFNPKPVDEAANGIFRNVAWAKPAVVSDGAKSVQILKTRDAQTFLSELGYQVGAPDGIAGAKTRDAIKSFEAVNGLPETGEITDDLLDRLEIASGA